MTKEQLYEQFKALSPQERNDRLQAMYSAYLASGHIDEFALEVFKVLTKSFDISIKFNEQTKDIDADTF